MARALRHAVVSRLARTLGSIEIASMNLETRLSRDLWDAVRMNDEKRNFSGAILDSFYFLGDLLCKKSGAEGGHG